VEISRIIKWCEMKQFMNISSITILILLITSYSFFAQEHSSTPGTSDTAKTGMVYQCPKDLGVISNVPGRCSKCDSELIELTMDQAMDNLSGGGQKKPELKNKTINMGKEEKTGTEEVSLEDEKSNIGEDSLEVTKDKSLHDHSAEHSVNVDKTDRNRNGLVYQCPMCPDQLSDESSDCLNCGMELVKRSVEDAKKNVPLCVH
jgi:uncharacterized protein with PIN domain